MRTAAAELPPIPSRRAPVLVDEGVALTKVYVWQIPVRVTHWLIALSIVVLAVTGIYIGRPFIAVSGPAGERFVMGTMRTIHFYAAIVFSLSVFARIVWMFLGNRYASWRSFLPVERRRWKGLWPTLEFYLFLLRKPPGFVGHNPVAGLSYTAVFALYLVEIATGFGLYAMSAAAGSPLRPFGFLLALFGGAQMARWIHHIVMWLLLGFAVHHVYSATLMSQIEQNATMESIFSGFKFVRREDLVHSGYRFRKPGPRAVESAPPTGKEAA
jgi:Ni/Fe-hydrogenase 1 B-type cytochrome subunit